MQAPSVRAQLQCRWLLPQYEGLTCSKEANEARRHAEQAAPALVTDAAHHILGVWA